MTQEEAKTIEMRICWTDETHDHVSLTRSEMNALMEGIKTNMANVIVHQFDSTGHEVFNLAHARSVFFLDLEAARTQIESRSNKALENP